jgi:hypothetical protein
LGWKGRHFRGDELPFSFGCTMGCEGALAHALAAAAGTR